MRPGRQCNTQDKHKQAERPQQVDVDQQGGNRPAQGQQSPRTRWSRRQPSSARRTTPSRHKGHKAATVLAQGGNVKAGHKAATVRHKADNRPAKEHKAATVQHKATTRTGQGTKAAIVQHKAATVQLKEHKAATVQQQGGTRRQPRQRQGAQGGNRPAQG